MRATRVGSVNERFFERFERRGDDDCWPWVGSVNRQGYGYIGGVLNGMRYVPKGSYMLAHRVSWILHRGEIPDYSPAQSGRVVMHLCDNPRCVNPKHLRLGTQSENVKDMVQKGRKVVGEALRRTGIDHFRSKVTRQEDVDLIVAGKHSNKELAAMFKVSVDVIKRVKRQNGAARPNPEKFKNKPLSQEDIDYIRSTPPGTRGLGKKFGVGKTTIANIRKGLTHAR